MAKARKNGLMAPAMKDNMKMVGNKAKESSDLLMDPDISENLLRMKFKEKENIIGRMVKFIKVNGI